MNTGKNCLFPKGHSYFAFRLWMCELLEVRRDTCFRKSVPIASSQHHHLNSNIYLKYDFRAILVTLHLLIFGFFAQYLEKQLYY